MPLIALILLLVALATAPTALAAPALDGEFPVSDKPDRFALGPDGNVWFTLDGTNEFGKITPDGTVTEYDVAAAVGTEDITAGPDGAVWMAANGKVVRVDPANPNAAQDFPIAGLDSGQGITTAPDGNLWAAGFTRIFKISPAGVKLDDDPAFVGARGLIRGGDGNLYAADFAGGAIVKVNPADSSAVSYAVGGGPQEVANGPAGQLGYSNPNSIFGRITTAGAFQETTMTGTDPFGIAFGEDGAYWTAQFAAHALGRITPEGEYTQLMLPAGSAPRYMTRGTGGTLWVGLQEAGKTRIARITGVTAPAQEPPPPPPPPPSDTTPPTLSALAVAPPSFRAAKGSTVRFVLSEAGTVALRLQRRRPGRVSGGRCVRPTKRLRRAKRCARWARFATLTRPAVVGANSIPLRRRAVGVRLVPGRYRVNARAKDVAGNASASSRAPFRVLAPRKRR